MTTPSSNFDSFPLPSTSKKGLSRREALTLVASAGIVGGVFQRALAMQLAAGLRITPDMVGQAGWIAGLDLTEEQAVAASVALTRAQRSNKTLRSTEVGYDVGPALHFFAEPNEVAKPQPGGQTQPAQAKPTPRDDLARPKAASDLAFLTLSELAALLRRREVSSLELTKLYLDRLHEHHKTLNCVVTFTDDLAFRQAKEADREIAAGRYRGPLHGAPWGAKDLISYPGYPTTWGCARFKDQKIDGKATVAQRLDDAGAVLLAKLSLGTLAWGDQWHGGLTRNPWNPNEGSSGSSAGSVAAVVAGLAGFTIGSETLGSIISPCRQCGATGLRPTFGRVSRHGCMSLAWSMDKLGPLARCVEDLALVFATICGPDGQDLTVVDRPFTWPMQKPLASLRVGYVEENGPAEKRADLKILRDLGVTLVPIELPASPPAGPLTVILGTEAAAVFDPLVRTGDLSDLGLWPDTFLKGQFTSAIDYLKANRIRTLLMRAMDQLFREQKLDAYISGDDVTITNFTGHPTVALPAGMKKEGDMEKPEVATITGKLFGETELLALAHAFEQAAKVYRRRPPLYA